MHRILTLTFLALALLFLACNTGVRPDTLEARTWILTAYEMDGKPQEVSDELTKLQFNAGKITGHTGCNQLGGNYSLKNSRLTTEKVFTTKMACPGMMERENGLTKALNGGPTLAMDKDNLLMSFDNVVLVFRQLPAVTDQASTEKT